MNVHKNAPLTPIGRAEMVSRVVERGWSAQRTAEAFGISTNTVRKWVRRFLDEGDAGLKDRSSRPRHVPHQTPVPALRRILALRRVYGLTGPEISRVTDLPRSTVARWLRRKGLGRLRPAQSSGPVRRYERAAPGELIHLDVKKLGRFHAVGHRATGTRAGTVRSRGAGWDFVHVAIDDYSRVAYVEVHDDEKGPTAEGFLRRAVAWYAARAVEVERVMTDNGSCYRAKQFRDAVAEFGARHIYTRPYTPKTNGKAERFIQTLINEWAYGVAYPSSAARNSVLQSWVRYYNEERSHSSVGHRPPVTRLSAPHNNVVRNDS